LRWREKQVVFAPLHRVVDFLLIFIRNAPADPHPSMTPLFFAMAPSRPSGEVLSPLLCRSFALSLYGLSRSEATFLTCPFIFIAWTLPAAAPASFWLFFSVPLARVTCSRPFFALADAALLRRVFPERAPCLLPISPSRCVFRAAARRFAFIRLSQILLSYNLARAQFLPGKKRVEAFNQVRRSSEHRSIFRSRPWPSFITLTNIPFNLLRGFYWSWASPLIETFASCKIASLF